MTEAVAEKKNAGRTRSRDGLVFKIVAYIFLALFCLWVLVPFYVIIITSLTSVTEIMSSIRFIWLQR